MTRPTGNPFYITGRPMSRVRAGGFPISDRPYLEDAITNSRPPRMTQPDPVVARILWWQPSRRRATRARNIALTRRPQHRAIGIITRKATP